MRTSILTIIVWFFLLYNTHGQIVFSEIMYDVATNEYHDEFIEVFNISYEDSIDCSGWTFSDSSGVDQILPHHGGTKIGPRKFALILDGSYFANSVTYDSLFTDSLIIMKIEDNSFGKNGLSNSMAEQLTICDSAGNVMSEYTYSIGNVPGHSDEKIILEENSGSANWSDSKIKGGTPGRRNSVSPPLYDFGFKENSLIFPFLLIADKAIVFSAEILDFGLKLPSDSIKIVAYCDLNLDGILQADDYIIGIKKMPAIAQLIDFEWNDPPAGEFQVVTDLYLANDENPENNRISTTIRILERNTSLHVNEIKFLTENEEPEWIELVNSGEQRILLKKWSFADLSDTVSIDTPIYIEPGEFIVFSEDSLSENSRIETEKLVILSKFPTLNDQEDEITLINPSGSWVERFRYNREWLEGEDFRSPSLERINPLLFENKSEHWGPCVVSSGGTPGKKNSIFSKLAGGKTDVIAKPNIFSPNQDGIDDVTVISGEIPETSARIKIEIYDICGRLIQELRNNVYSGSRFNLVWDGRDQEGAIARIGIYIIYIQAINDRLGVLHEMTTTVVLAQKL